MNATEQEINAAESFLMRCGIPLDRDYTYLDITGALFAAAAHMDAGSEVMQLALNIERIRKNRVKAQSNFGYRRRREAQHD